MISRRVDACRPESRMSHQYDAGEAEDVVAHRRHVGAERDGARAAVGGSRVTRGFTFDIDSRALGYQIRAMVWIRPLPRKLHLVEKLIQETPQFIECDKIIGDDPFLGRLVVHSIEEMDEVLEALSDHAVTSTAVIKAQSVTRRLPPLRA